MATLRVKSSNSKSSKPEAAVATRESLDAQIAAFINGGGEIQQIAKGVSGQQYGGTRQITISRK